MSARTWLAMGALLGGMAVVIGAFGAHWLKENIASMGISPEEQVHRLAIWETAVHYQMYHALALLAVGILGMKHNSRSTQVAGWSFLLGSLVFSGSLYLLVLSGLKILGAITPIGGVFMIVGWLALTVSALKYPASNEATR